MKAMKNQSLCPVDEAGGAHRRLAKLFAPPMRPGIVRLPQLGPAAAGGVTGPGPDIFAGTYGRTAAPGCRHVGRSATAVGPAAGARRSPGGSAPTWSSADVPGEQHQWSNHTKHGPAIPGLSAGGKKNVEGGGQLYPDHLAILEWLARSGGCLVRAWWAEFGWLGQKPAMLMG